MAEHLDALRDVAEMGTLPDQSPLARRQNCNVNTLASIEPIDASEPVLLSISDATNLNGRAACYSLFVGDTDHRRPQAAHEARNITKHYRGQPMERNPTEGDAPFSLASPKRTPPMSQISTSQLASEELRPLAIARHWFPGRPPSGCSLRRYVSVGCRQVKLDSIILSGVRHTSREAVMRFLAAVSEADLRAGKSTTEDDPT